MFEEMERLKLRFLEAFHELTQRGAMTEGQLAEVIEIIDRIDDLPVEEIKAQLGRYITDVRDDADVT